MVISDGDLVIIKEIIIDRKVAQLLQENKNKQAIRWDSLRNAALLVIGVDKNNLVILRDPTGQEIHISARALEQAP